jgi:hypothetical protein
VLKPVAADMGADAIVGFYNRKPPGEDENVKFRSGLAVRFLSENEEYISKRTDFIVAIPPPIISEPSGKEEENAERVEWMNEAAQFELEKKGYYGKIVESGENISIDHINSLSEQELSDLFGQECEYILLTEFLSSDKSSIGIMNSDVMLPI